MKEPRDRTEEIHCLVPIHFCARWLFKNKVTYPRESIVFAAHMSVPRMSNDGSLFPF